MSKKKGLSSNSEHILTSLMLIQSITSELQTLFAVRIQMLKLGMLMLGNVILIKLKQVF